MKTTDSNTVQETLVGLSFAVSIYEAAYVPIGKNYIGVPARLKKEAVLKQLQPLIEDQSKIIICQNLKHDGKVLAKEGLAIRAKTYDILLESYVLHSGSTRNLDTLAIRYLGYMTKKFGDAIKKERNRILR